MKIFLVGFSWMNHISILKKFQKLREKNIKIEKESKIVREKCDKKIRFKKSITGKRNIFSSKNCQEKFFLRVKIVKNQPKISKIGGEWLKK